MSTPQNETNTAKTRRALSARLFLWAWAAFIGIGLLAGGVEFALSVQRPSLPLSPVATQPPLRLAVLPDEPPLDLNAASFDDLLALPGIGPATARAILAYRESIGRFYYPEELMDVRGIGEKTFAALQPLVACGP